MHPRKLIFRLVDLGGDKVLPYFPLPPSRNPLLAERGITSVDHVISGLPLPSFPAGLRDAVIAASAKVLTPTGTFRQLTQAGGASFSDMWTTDSADGCALNGSSSYTCTK